MQMPFCFGESQVLDTASAWLADGHAVALGTVVRTTGSAPRQTGSHIAVRDDGAFAGSVSAGCVESAVIEEAIAVMREGKNRRLIFGAADDGTFSVGLMCGGEIEVVIEPIA